MIALIVVVFQILCLLSSIHAVMTARTQQGAMAWAVSLATFPYVAAPACWVLGRSRFQAYVVAHRAETSEIIDLSDAATRSVSEWVVPREELSGGLRAGEGLAGLPFLRGNSVELLVDGDATFASILDGIDAAEDYILFQFYIVHDDRIGREIKGHLIARAREGVRVYFLYDEVGSHDLPKAYLEDLRAAGIEAYDFHTRKGPRNRFQLNFRNHRKVVVDGKAAWVGGHNVGDEYLGLDPKAGHWRDTHVRIEGPAAQVAQARFLGDWYWAKRTIPDLDWEPKAASTGADVMAMVLPIAPIDDIETAQLFIAQALNAARDRIWIATPDFVPDEAVMAALRLAALRGVDVRVIVPDRDDHSLVDLAARWYANELDDVGITFLRYTDGFPHQKVLLVDNDISSVGSPNFDNRSFRLQFEINALVVDGDFGRELEAMLEIDMAHSIPWDPDDLDRASFTRRVAVSAAQLTAPLLWRPASPRSLAPATRATDAQWLVVRRSGRLNLQLADYHALG